MSFILKKQQFYIKPLPKYTKFVIIIKGINFLKCQEKLFLVLYRRKEWGKYGY